MKILSCSPTFNTKQQTMANFGKSISVLMDIMGRYSDLHLVAQHILMH